MIRSIPAAFNSVRRDNFTDGRNPFCDQVNSSKTGEKMKAIKAHTVVIPSVIRSIPAGKKMKEKHGEVDVVIPSVIRSIPAR